MTPHYIWYAKPEEFCHLGGVNVDQSDALRRMYCANKDTRITVTSGVFLDGSLFLFSLLQRMCCFLRE